MSEQELTRIIVIGVTAVLIPVIIAFILFSRWAKRDKEVADRYRDTVAPKPKAEE
jgi:flagellar biosynthesis component FlhA